MIGFFNLKRSVFILVRKKDYMWEAGFREKITGRFKISHSGKKKANPFFIFAAHE
jgi:hypothetical protein